MNILAIIQSRSTSTRLPGKCFLKFGDETMIERIYNRIKSCFFHTVVAIPYDDRKLETHLQKKHIPYFLGDEYDVLKRYIDCAMQYHIRPKYIVRITGDCPCPNLIYLQLLRKHLESLNEPKWDFYSNVSKRTFPDGEDFEISTLEFLAYLHSVVENKEDREHVFSYAYKFFNSEIGKNSKFYHCSIISTVNLSHIKTSIDTIEDYERVVKIAL